MTSLGILRAEMPRDVAAAFDRIAVHQYRVSLVALGDLPVPPARLANALRGTFEITFRRMLCHDLALECRNCPLYAGCWYPAVFRPSPPPGSERLSRQRDLPRPFVFVLPPGGHVVRCGEEVQIGLHLFGRANESLPYTLVSLRAMCERGLGNHRVRFRVRSVAAIDRRGDATPVYTEGSPVISLADCPVRLADLRRQCDEQARSIRVRFLSPTTLKRGGDLVRQPSLEDVVCRLRDRVSALAAFYGDGPIEADFVGVARTAAKTRMVSHRLQWERRLRRSARTGEVHELSGVTGEAEYEGPVGTIMPLLRLGELVHVGKYAVWGNGRIGVEVTG